MHMKQELSIIYNFLKDKLSLILIYFINTAVIILFFNLSLGSREWIYPCLLSLVIFAPYLIIQYYYIWIKDNNKLQGGLNSFPVAE